MFTAEKIQLAKEYLEQAERCLEQGNKRLAIGNFDHSKEYIQEVVHLLIAQIEEEEGEY